MYIRNLRFKLIAGLGILAMVVALPGSAKPTAPSAAVAAQPSAFGLFLDPNVAPELHFELPKTFRF